MLFFEVFAVRFVSYFMCQVAEACLQEAQTFWFTNKQRSVSAPSLHHASGRILGLAQLCQCRRVLAESSVQGTLNQCLYCLILDSQKFLGCPNLPLENCKSFSIFLMGTLRLTEWYHRILCNFSRTGTFLGGELVSFLFPSSLLSLGLVAEVDLN